MIEINVFKNSFCFFWEGSVPMFITHYMCSVLEVAIIQFFFFFCYFDLAFEDNFLLLGKQVKCENGYP